MSLVFDTSILIELERKNPEIIKKISFLARDYPNYPQLSFMSYYEFIRGLKINKDKNYKKKLDFINKFSILKTSKKTAEILADLRIKYDKKGISLSLTDLFISAQVIENQLILVTKDKDFEKIDELKKIIF
jgi:predicted nucleic acid-binding protein